MIFSDATDIILRLIGDVPKWLKGADSKSARRRKACGGSNPSISARETTGFDLSFFYRNKSLRICEIAFGGEMLLCNVKYLRMCVDLFTHIKSLIC